MCQVNQEAWEPLCEGTLRACRYAGVDMTACRSGSGSGNTTAGRRSFQSNSLLRCCFWAAAAMAVALPSVVKARDTATVSAGFQHSCLITDDASVKVRSSTQCFGLEGWAISLSHRAGALSLLLSLAMRKRAVFVLLDSSRGGMEVTVSPRDRPADALESSGRQGLRGIAAGEATKPHRLSPSRKNYSSLTDGWMHACKIGIVFYP